MPPAKLVEQVRQELAGLGVADPKVFLPDDNDEIAAAAAQMVMLREDPGVPEFAEVDQHLNMWGGFNCDEGEVVRCLGLFQSFYNNGAFLEQVIEPLARKKLEVLREQDGIWEKYKK